MPSSNDFVNVSLRRNTSDCPRFPQAGERLESVRVGLLTVNALGRVAVPPPGLGFVTVTPCAPRLARGAIVIRVVSNVGLPSGTTETEMLSPKETVVIPETKPLPVSFTLTV